MIKKQILFIIVILYIINTKTLLCKKDEKFEYLLEKSKKNAIIRLFEDDFNDIVLSGPRSYSLIVLLTTSRGCDICSKMKPAYYALGQEYHKQQLIDLETKDKDDLKPFVFITYLDASDKRCLEVFKKMDLNHVPHLFHVRPAQKRGKRSYKTLLKKLPPQDLYSVQSNGVTTQNFVDWIERITGVSVDVPQPFDFSFIFKLIIPIIFIAAGIKFKWNGKKVFYRVGLVAFTFAISGGMFNIIRGVPTHVYDKNSATFQFIHPQTNNQFAYEGFFIGSLNILAGLILVEMFKRMQKLQKYKSVLILGGMVSVHFIFRIIRGIYTRKNGGYRMGHLF